MPEEAEDISPRGLTPNQVSKIVDKHIKYMKWNFFLNRWMIHFCYEDGFDGMNQDVVGLVEFDVGYPSATIRLNCRKLLNESDVIDTVTHELLHLVLEPLRGVLHSVFLKSDIPQCAKDIGQSVYMDAEERVLCHLTTMLENYGTDTRELEKRQETKLTGFRLAKKVATKKRAKK